jgi:hypothetical protein
MLVPFAVAQFLGYIVSTPGHLMPTLLDRIYFEEFSLFSHHVDHSAKFKTELTRAGVHVSAGEGIESLLICLVSRSASTPAEQDAFLEVCLAEEFLTRTDSSLDLRVVRTLLEYDLGLQNLLVKLDICVMLRYVIKPASKQGIRPATHDIYLY